MNLDNFDSKDCGDYTLYYDKEVYGHEGPNHLYMDNYEVRTLYAIELPEGNRFEDASDWDEAYSEEFGNWDSLQEELYDNSCIRTRRFISK